MGGFSFQAARGYRLDPPGHPQGVSCDEQGPALGPLRLLTKTDAGFMPRPAQELQILLSHIFGQQVDCSDLLPGLRSIACALNDADHRSRDDRHATSAPARPERSRGSSSGGGDEKWLKPLPTILNILAGRRTPTMVSAENFARKTVI